MRKFLLVLCFLVFSVIGYSETNSKPSFVMTFQPLPIFFFPVLDAYNVNTTMMWAIPIGAIGTSLGVSYGSPNLYPFIYDNSSSSAVLADCDVFIRFSPIPNGIKGTLDGFYIGTGLRYEFYGSATRYIHRTGMLLDIGYQFILDSGFVFDLNLGGGNYLFTSSRDTYLPKYYGRCMAGIGFAL